MEIPYFLRPENIKKLDPQSVRMMELINEYKDHFGNEPTTEPSTYSTEEWIGILKKCIDDNITVLDLLDGELETGDQHEHDNIIELE